MYTIYNWTTGSNVEIEDSCGPFQVLSYRKKLSTPSAGAQQAYYESRMRKRKRQLVCQLEVEDVLIAQGMMQWMVGDCEMVSGVSNILAYLEKLMVSRMTKQSAISPHYSGTGTIALEPVEDEILLLDLDEWPEGVVLESNAFLACSSTIEQTVVSRKTVSSALFGNEGLFSMCLQGTGYAAILAPCVKEQLIVIDLEDDALRIDGHFAIAWSNSLSFTVENSGATAAASVISDEGMINTYRGTGRVLLAPFGSGEIQGRKRRKALEQEAQENK